MLDSHNITNQVINFRDIYIQRVLNIKLKT